MSPADPFAWISLGQLLDAPPPAVPFLWGSEADGLMQERSFVMLHSAEKQGKSMFSLNVALAGAKALPTFLDIPVRPGGFRTAIVQNEVHLRAVYERFRRMLRGGALTREEAERVMLNGYRATTLADSAALSWFKKKMREWRPDLVIIDPLAHQLGVDENSNAEVGKALKPLLALRDDPGCAILVVHHDSKVSEQTSARPAQQRSRGANRLTADPDSIISLVPRKRHGGPTAQLECTARYGQGLAPFRIRMNPETFMFERYDEVQERGEQLAGWVREAGGSITEKALLEVAEEKWGVSDTQGRHRTAKRRIAQAVEAGLLVRLELTSGVAYEIGDPRSEG